MGERLNGIQEVRGSIPLTSTGPVVRGCMCGNSSVGRAQPCEGWGRGFESRFPLWMPVKDVRCGVDSTRRVGRLAQLVRAPR